MRSLASKTALAAAIGLLALGRATADDAAPMPKLATAVAFPKLSFDRPVAMADPGDGSGLLFVAEQHVSKIQSFKNDPGTAEKVEFLHLPDPINHGNEEGLLGLAFHPKYKENGQFFVYYSANDKGERRSVVSRFNVSKDDPRKADPASEQRVWVSEIDPYENHNGGCIDFGPDGHLYISLGDSGFADDPLTTGQNPADFFGSILRIDVDHPADGKPYGIPKDNPRLRDPKFAKWAPEVYCIGLRNVWKFTFDKTDGTLWAGDVGQNLWEMVHVITNGGNYGWSLVEANHPFRRRQTADAASPVTKPVSEYPHNLGQPGKREDIGKSITGGYVYRGKAIPALVGAYVYGDYDSGRIWGVRPVADKVQPGTELIDLGAEKRKLNIAGFGQDADGELFILAFDGKVHKLVARP